MNALTKLATGTAFAFAFTGATVLWTSGAAADSDHTDCTGNDCVTMHCYDDGWCQRSAEYDRRDADQDRNVGPAGYMTGPQPPRYACDADGENCHTTRQYYYDDDGRPIFDPDVSP